MNDAYTSTVRQLLEIAPVVFSSHHFAIKGGTALNLFLNDLPRLSVDIDVVFTNHSLDRESALQAIAAELSAISQKLEAMGYEVLQRRNSANNESKLIVQSPLAQVKVEVNEVFRGTLLPQAMVSEHRGRIGRHVTDRRDALPLQHCCDGAGLSGGNYYQPSGSELTRANQQVAHVSQKKALRWPQ